MSQPGNVRPRTHVQTRKCEPPDSVSGNLSHDPRAACTRCRQWLAGLRRALAKTWHWARVDGEEGRRKCDGTLKDQSSRAEMISRSPFQKSCFCSSPEPDSILRCCYPSAFLLTRWTDRSHSDIVPVESAVKSNGQPLVTAAMPHRPEAAEEKAAEARRG